MAEKKQNSGYQEWGKLQREFAEIPPKPDPQDKPVERCKHTIDMFEDAEKSTDG